MLVKVDSQSSLRNAEQNLKSSLNNSDIIIKEMTMKKIRRVQLHRVRIQYWKEMKDAAKKQ